MPSSSTKNSILFFTDSDRIQIEKEHKPRIVRKRTSGGKYLKLSQETYKKFRREISSNFVWKKERVIFASPPSRPNAKQKSRIEIVMRLIIAWNRKTASPWCVHANIPQFLLQFVHPTNFAWNSVSFDFFLHPCAIVCVRHYCLASVQSWIRAARDIHSVSKLNSL